jgi:pimeloyl-ACP methyl ester carboxylesterase
MTAEFPKLDVREEHFLIPGPRAKLKLFLRYLPSLRTNGTQRRPVLYVHGATFPSATSIAHRFDGFSWRDALNEAGFDVWALDFLGFGYSDRYPEMDAPPETHAPLCNAEDAANQLEAAVPFILEHQRVPRLSFVSHSWGSMPVGRFAGKRPALVDRWVMFGPIARHPPRRYESVPPGPAWRLIGLEDQWKRFIEDVPPGEAAVLSRRHFDDWGESYLDSDRGSRDRTPPSVKIPTGPFHDILRAWHGDLAYDPAAVLAPVALMRGEWDGVIPDSDARWLFDAFKASREKRDIKIGRGTHLMHLEVMRAALYFEANAFLSGATNRTHDRRNPA